MGSPESRSLRVHALAPWLLAHVSKPHSLPCTWPNGQPAPVTVSGGLESREQLVVTCSAPQLCFPPSSCWALGYVRGKSLGEVGAASILSHVRALFLVVAQFHRQAGVRRTEGPGSLSGWRRCLWAGWDGWRLWLSHSDQPSPGQPWCPVSAAHLNFHAHCRSPCLLPCPCPSS